MPLAIYRNEQHMCSNNRNLIQYQRYKTYTQWQQRNTFSEYVEDLFKTLFNNQH